MVKAKADTHVLVLEEVGVCPVQYYHCWIWKNLTATQSNALTIQRAGMILCLPYAYDQTEGVSRLSEEV